MHEARKQARINGVGGTPFNESVVSLRIKSGILLPHNRVEVRFTSQRAPSPRCFGRTSSILPRQSSDAKW